MKKIYFVLGLVIALFVITSCGSKKAALNGDVEVIVPCSGPEYSSNDEYFRGGAMAQSSDQNMAKKKAMQDARALLATAIAPSLKRVIDQYGSSYDQKGQDEVRGRYMEISRTVVNQQLNDVRVICEKMTKSSEGKYKCYIALEMSKDGLLETMNKNILNDEKLRTDYEYEKFKQIYEEEIGATAPDK